MIIFRNERVFFETREHYGTSIEIQLSYDDDGTLKKVSFSPNKERESLDIPETKEDRKVFLVINAVKELIELNQLSALTASVYERDIIIKTEDDESLSIRKIEQALLEYLNIKPKGMIYFQAEATIYKALCNGEIDVF